MAIELDPLLADNDWCRRLAQRLVGDPDLAEDLVQDAWVAALEHPEARRSRRSWLGGVLVNLSRQFHRSEGRRRERERRAARPEALPSVAEVAAEVGLRRTLADLLLALEEPLRTTLFLRYFRERSLREVAGEMGVSTSTVHEREQRGLDRLRIRLDARHAGNRNAWITALVPLTRVGEGIPASSLGGIAMGTTLKITLASAAAAGLAFGVWVQEDPDSAPTAGTPGVARAREVPVEKQDLVLEPIAAEREATAPTRPAQDDEREQEAPARVAPEEIEGDRISGRVIDLDLHTLSGVALGWRGADPLTQPLARTDSNGSFSFEAPDKYADSIVARDPGLATLIPGQPGPSDAAVTVVVAPRVTFAGKVLDEEGIGIEAARLSIQLKNDLYRRLGVERNHWDHPADWTTESGADGSFELADGCGGEGIFMRVEHAEYEDRVLDLSRSADFGMTIVLERPLDKPAVWGRVVDSHGRPVSEALVSVGGPIESTDELGEFRIPLDGVGEVVHLRALKQGHRPGSLEFERDTTASPVILELGSTPLSISGRVVDADGKPIPSVTVWARDLTPFGTQTRTLGDSQISFDVDVEDMLAGGSGAARDDPGATTDEAGHFRVEGLLPRTYELALLDRTSLASRLGVRVEAGSREIEIVLDDPAETAHVAGRVVSLGGHPLPGVSVRPQRSLDPEVESRFSTGPSSTLVMVTDEEGGFVFPRLTLERTGLILEGPDIPPFHRVELADHEDPGDLEIVVALTCRFRVDFSDQPDWADHLRVLDESGVPLTLSESYGLFHTLSDEHAVSEGRTGVVESDERAHTLVLLKDGVEVARRGVELVPGEVTLVEP